MEKIYLAVEQAILFATRGWIAGVVGTGSGKKLSKFILHNVPGSDRSMRICVIQVYR